MACWWWVLMLLAPAGIRGEGAGGRPSQAEIFRQLFAQKRVEHILAIKKLIALDEGKRRQLLDSMMVQFFSVVGSSRTTLAASGLGIGHIEPFPSEDAVQNALALIMENTCFLSDILLRFPDYLHPKLTAQPTWDLDYKWGLNFVAESGLIDANTRDMVHLASQEIGVLERHPDFVNPYRIERVKPSRFVDLPPPTQKPRKKLKRGPQLSRSEL